MPALISFDEVDVAYRAQRQRFRNVVVAGVARLWATADMHEQDVFAARAISLVTAAQSQTVNLTSAYLLAKTRRATGKGQGGRINSKDYTTESLRGISALEVYTRPFGAVGAALARGEEFPVAMLAGRASLLKAAATDIQLAQTYAARDWMGTEPEITSMGRLVAGGCDYCQQAADVLMPIDEAMPIHEHCQCSVVPAFGDEPTGLPDFSEDGELGARLNTG